MRTALLLTLAFATLATTTTSNLALGQTFSTVTPPVPGPTTITSSVTAAPNWQLVTGGAADSACVHHWDPATRSTKGAYRKAWFMDSCRDPHLADDGTFRDGPSVKMLIYANCSARTLATVQTVQYAGLYGTGDVGRSAQREVHAKDFAEPAPGSAEADELRLLCPGKPAKRR